MRVNADLTEARLRRPLRRAARRLRTLLPPGTLATGAGVAILAVASYVHLAIAGHELTYEQMADLSVVWSLVFSVGYGLFLPVEQELTRVSAGRRVGGAGTRPAWMRAAVITTAMVAGLTVLAAASSPLVAREIFGGSIALVWVTVGGLVALAAAAPLRGQSAGMTRFGLYGGVLGLDGALRIVAAVGLAVAGADSAVAFGLVLTAAPLLAVLLLLRAVHRTATPGPPVTWRELGRGVWPLVVSMSLGQFMLNSVVVAARLLAPAEAALTAALLVALILVRVPTLAFGAMQATLLHGLSSAAAAADRAQFARFVRQGSGVVTALMAATAAVLVAAGPWLVRVLFDAPNVLGRLDFLVLAGGTWAYLLALVLGQALMALHRHRHQMLWWSVGAALLVVTTLIPGDVATRLTWAYLIGNVAVASGLGAALVVASRLDWRSHERPSGGRRPKLASEPPSRATR